MMIVNFQLGLIFSQQTFNINQNEFAFSYNINSSCNLLNSSSSNVHNSLKCLIMCQQTQCESLLFDDSTNQCSLTGARPSLIQYETLPNLSLNYVLSKKTLLLNKFRKWKTLYILN